VTITKTIKMRLAMREVLSWEFTKPQGAVPQYFNWSDLGATASSRLYQIPVIGVDMYGSLAAFAPISKTSQFQQLMFAGSTGLGLAKNIDIPVKGDYHMNLNIRYDFGFRKNFHRYVTPLIEANTATPGQMPLAIKSTTDPFIDGNLTRGAATNVSHTMTNGLTVAFTPHDFVTLTYFTSITNGFKYALQGTATVDQFTSPNAKIGPGRTDSIISYIDLTISPVAWMWISTGIYTAQPIFAPDNKTVMNFIWNAGSAANNYSQIYLQVGGQI
jgi:hypothetical protein